MNEIKQHIVAVIPARYGSTRLPGKPLKMIGDRPMLVWVYNRVRIAQEIDEIYVATDDQKIADMCDNYEIPYIMTSSEHRTAANRLKEVSDSVKADFYLQINGDEPLINMEAVVSAIPKNIPQDEEFGTNIITEIKK